MEKKRQIIKKLGNQFFNIRAEVAIEHLLEMSHLEIEDITFLNKGIFKRAYRRDVLAYKVNQENDTIEISLARNGIYDNLPQGLFHKNLKHKTDKSFNELRAQGKQEEKQARAFFAPIENEFFLQKLLICKNESKINKELANSDSSFLLDLWGVKDKVDAKYVFSLTKLLPLAYKISKSRVLIAKALEEILQEKVTVEEKYKTLKVNANNKINTNNELSLGANSILDCTQTNYRMPYYNIKLILNNKTAHENYLKNGISHQLIEVFCEFFIPFEMDWQLEVFSSIQKENFFNLGANSEAVLGLTTIL